jgi:HK97 family phage major capsid protein
MPATVHVSPLAKGTNLSRFLQSLIVSRGNLREALEYSKQWTDSPAVGFVLKTAIGAGSTGSVDWSALYPYGVDTEFLELERSTSIVGQLSGLMRPTSFHTKVPRQLGMATASWIEELHPKSVSSGLRFDNTSLERRKIIALTVISEELGQASPQNEATVRVCLTSATSKQIDNTFLDPAQAPGNASPGSINSGATSITSSGTNAAAVSADISKMISSLTSWVSPRFLMSPQTAAKILGTSPTTFEGLTAATGSTLFGIPVITGAWAPAGLVTLVDAATILFNDGGVSISASTQGAAQMDSAATDPPTSSTVLTSFFQQNLIGLRAERVISWARTTNTSVVYLQITFP